MVKNYHVDNVTIEEILGWIKQGKIGLPEMQRPFVWSTAKVRDLIDSLYNGYPIGYIVTWQNPAIGLKNDSSSNNKEIIIDGQQRVTTLTLLLIALRDYAINHPEDTSINSRRIDNMLLKNEYENGDERYKLLLTENDRDILVRLVEKKPIPENTVSRLLTNHRFL